MYALVRYNLEVPFVFLDHLHDFLFQMNANRE